MALPTQITVTGTLLNIDGGPAEGQVTFQSSVGALDSGSETVVVPSSAYKTLDENGSFTIVLPASDDPAWTPVGWTYNVIVRIDDNKTSFRTVIPYDADGGTIWFSELTPALDGGSELYAPYSHTHEGSGPGGTVAWNDVTGKPSTFPPSAHTHDDRYFTETETTTLLAGKASTSHTHTKSEVGLANVDNTSDASKPISTATQTALDEKAAASHAHVISDVTSLQTALDGKSSTGHGHAISDVTNLQTSLDGKAATSHTHTISNVTGLQTVLDTKADDSEITALDGRLDTLEAVTAPIFSWNGSAYVEDDDARIYVGPSDPGSVPDGSVWIEVV